MPSTANGICPQCGRARSAEALECPRCGIVYAKYRSRLARPPAETRPRGAPRKAAGETQAPRRFEVVKALLFQVPEEFEPLRFWGSAALLALMAIWGLKFICIPSAAFESFLHLVDLPFHEAGHIVFRPFGRLMTALGGALGQLLMPLVCLGVLLLKTRDPFGAAACLWWFGQNLADIAPYVGDARALALPLLGGNTGETSPYGFHDWEFILTETGLLEYDRLLAGLAHGAGAAVMIAACLWGGGLLRRQYRNKRGA
jgi:hypothetical protein